MLKPYHNARVNGNTTHISGTLRELYDFIIGRLAGQGKRSICFTEDNEPHCCYYNPCENIACAVGHIHPTFFHQWDGDEELSLQKGLRTTGVTITSDVPDMIELLMALQSTHDLSRYPETFVQYSEGVADRFSLSSDILNEVSEWC